MSRKFVIENKRYVSGKSIGYILPPKRSINIDDKYDLLLAQKKINEK